jgi:hypothetical protein
MGGRGKEEGGLTVGGSRSLPVAGEERIQPEETGAGGRGRGGAGSRGEGKLYKPSMAATLGIGWGEEEGGTPSRRRLAMGRPTRGPVHRMRVLNGYEISSHC